MSVFLKIAGAAMMVLGAVLCVTFFASPGWLNARGVGLEPGVLLIIGGILATGQAGLIAALKSRSSSHSSDSSSRSVTAAVAPAITSTNNNVTSSNAIGTNPFKAKPDVPSFGAGAAVATAGVAAAAGAGLAAMTAKAAAKDPVADTISALEQAKADVIKSIGGMDAMAKEPDPVAIKHEAAAMVHPPEPAAVDEDTAEMVDDDGLYVVEEKVVRGRPARILSDATVEAETDEGWMRFENMEHLNEYLDSVEEQSA